MFVSSIIPVAVVIVLFFLIVRIATVILKMTGLDEKTALFQAVSSFTGTGFTTKEAEVILEDEVRRKTVTVLMILGKVGIVSVIASFILSFGKDNLFSDLRKVALLVAVILVLYKAVSMDRFSLWLNRIIEKKIVARGIVEQKTLEEVFRLPKGYGIAKLHVGVKSEELGKTLAGAGFIKKDILVLSIERKNELISFPHADDIIEEEDTLLCYGLLKSIKLYA